MDEIMIYRELSSDKETEHRAKELLDNQSFMDGSAFPVFERKNKDGVLLKYRTMNSSRQGRKSDKPRKENNINNPKRDEEYIAMDIFEQGRKSPIEGLGYILDYQTPLGGNKERLVNNNPFYLENGNKFSVRKMNIDLLSYDSEKNIIHVLELKTLNSKESLLRCVVEGYTYLSVLDKIALLKNMQEIYPELKIPDNVLFKTAPLVFKDGVQEKEYNNKNLVNVHELMRRLNIVPIILEKYEERKYRVVK